MRIFHVTEILGKYVDFSRIPDQVLFEACQRGQIVHSACSALALGAWVRPLPPTYSGYFESFERWFNNNVKRVVIVEKTFVNETLGYTGRPDLVVELINGLFLLVDIKTPIAEGKTWKVQLAAYNYLLNQVGIFPQSSASLRLKPNGAEAIAVRYDDWIYDFNIFLSALNAHRSLIG